MRNAVTEGWAARWVTSAAAGRSRAAGEGFVLHAAFVGADGDMPGTDYLDEIDVGAFGEALS